MKKIIVVAMLALILTPKNVSGSEKSLIRATVYTADANATTYDGTQVKEGILAGRKDWIGKRAALYDMEHNLIGVYEFRDIGGHKHLKNGTRIDVFRSSLDRCNSWVKQYGDYVYMEVID